MKKDIEEDAGTTIAEHGMPLTYQVSTHSRYKHAEAGKIN